MSTTTHQGAEGAETMTAGDPVTILYTNYRGETAVRRIVPGSEHPGLGALWLGETEWHPGTQWLLAARDVEKDAHRVFALSGIKAWGQAAVDAALSTPAPRTDGGMTAGEDHFGYLFHNPDTGEEWSENHPVESGEVEDAENVRPATAKALHELLIEAWSELEDARADLATPAQPAGAVPESLREAIREYGKAEWSAGYATGRDGAGPNAAAVDRLSLTLRALEALLSTHPAGQSDDDTERCIACNKPLKAGDRVLPDAEGGTIHAACCGPERESYTGADGEPLGLNDPIPQGYVYEPEPPAGQSAGSGADILAATLAEFQRRNGYHRREIEELLTEFGELLLSKVQPAPDSTRTGQGEAVCDTCGLSIQECNARASASAEAFAEMRRDPAWLPTIKDRPKALWEVAFEKGYLAARPAAPEAQ